MAGLALRGHDAWVAVLQEPIAEARKLCDALGRDDPLRRKIEPELLKFEGALAEGGSPEPGRLHHHHPMELVERPRLKGASAAVAIMWRQRRNWRRIRGDGFSCGVGGNEGEGGGPGGAVCLFCCDVAVVVLCFVEM